MPHQHTKDWIDIVAAFAPTLGIFVAIAVAVMQWHVQREQWKQTLYHDRSKVYWAVMDLWEKLPKDVPIDEREFATKVLPATHLFGSDMEKYLSQIKQRLFYIDGQYSPADRKKARAALTAYIAHHFEARFDPYLQLHHDDTVLRRLKAQIDRWVDCGDAKLAARYDRSS